jgi:hypothetical protein
MSAVISPIRDPLIEGGKSYHQITEDICSPTERTPSRGLGNRFHRSGIRPGILCVLRRMDRLDGYW